MSHTRPQEPSILDAVALVTYNFSRAVLVGAAQGVVEGVDGVVNTILHPVQAMQGVGHLAYKIHEILYDATLISAGHLSTSPIDSAYQSPDIDSTALDFARHAVQSNPQLYLDAKQRMEGRINQLEAAGQRFANQPWHEQIRIATKAIVSFGTNIVASGAVINSIKAVANLQKYGIPHNPPSFHYWMERTRGVMSHPIYELADIHALKGEHRCLYAIMENNRLIISPQFVLQEKMIPWENGQLVKRVYNREIKHSELTKYAPVLCAGEVRVTDGLVTMINRDSGRYLAFGPHIPKMVERRFHDYGLTEAIGKFVETHGGIGSQLAIKVPNKMGLTPPGSTTGGIVQRVIAEGLKAQQEQDSRKQQQEAHEKIVQAEKRHQAANWHADQTTQRNIIANTKHFNLPYVMSARHTLYTNLLYRAEQDAIWDFRLRYGFTTPGIEFQIAANVRSNAWLATSLTSNYYYNNSGLADLSLALLSANLTSTWNACNSLYLYNTLSTFGFVGGITTKTSIVPSMLNSKAHALAEQYYFCFPADLFTDKESLSSDDLMNEVMWEMEQGFTEGTLPFFSLDFNQQGALHPIIHPVWKKLGKVVGFLDYYLKCAANGGRYKEEFLTEWHKTANTDEEFLKANWIDMKKECKEMTPAINFMSLREKLISEYNVDNDKSSHFSYNQPMMASLRISAELESMEQHDNILIPHWRFKFNFNIDMMPDYEQYVKSYQKKHGQFPTEYQKTLQCFQAFTEELEKIMPQLPFCKPYFDRLGMATSLAYFYKTLHKMGQKPVVVSPAKEELSSFPKVLPPLPVRYYRRYALPLTIKDMISALTATPEISAMLNNSLHTLFEKNGKIVVPEFVRNQLELIVKNKITEMLSTHHILPKDLAELNSTDITNTVDLTIEAILISAKKNRRFIHHKVDKIINELHWLKEVEKKQLIELPLSKKMEELKKQIADYINAVKRRWEKDQKLAKTEILQEIPAYAHEIIIKKIKTIEDSVAEEMKKHPNLTAEQKSKIDELLTKDIYNICLSFIDVQLALLEQEINEQQNKITHFSNTLLENEKLAAYTVSTNYTHAFVTFSGKEMTENNRYFRINGGCGLSVPDIETTPIRHAQSFVDEIAAQFSKNSPEKETSGKITFKHNGIAYVAYRIPVTDIKNELNVVTDKRAQHETALATLRSVNEHFIPANTLTSDVCQIPLDNKGTSILHGAAANLAPETFSQLLSQNLAIKDHFGNLPIHHAVEAGNIKNVELMLNKKPDLIKEQNHRGLTPLMLAVGRGDLEMVKLLHGKGAAFNQCLPNDQFPLYMALLKNFTNVALWMVANVAGLDVNLSLNSKMTALHLAIHMEETSLAMNLIEKGALCDIRRKSDGYTALHCAAQQGNLNVLTTILTKYPKLVDLPLESGKTPLHLAAESGHIDAVKLLIQKGANVNSITNSDETPLMDAIYNGKEEVARYLAAIAEINKVNLNQQTASLLAMQYAMPVVADILIKRKENLLILDQFGFNGLYYLVRSGEYSKVKKLLRQGINVNQEYAGQTLLAVAAQSGHFLIVHALLAPTITPKAIYKSNTTFSLLDYAVMANEVQYLQDNLSSIADVKRIALIAIQAKAKTCLELLLEKRESELVKHIDELWHASIMINSEELIKLLLKKNAEIKKTLDNEGNTALHLAVKYGAHKILPVLVESGAEFGKQNKLKQTAFHLAILQKDHDILERLFKQSLNHLADWPLDIWHIDKKYLTEKLCKVLDTYKKILDKDKQIALMKIKASSAPFHLFKEEIKTSKIIPCPLLNESQHRLIRKLKKHLSVASYDDALILLNTYPFLLKILQTDQGGPLLQTLFEHISELSSVTIDESRKKEEQVDSLKLLLTLFKKSGIQPALFTGKYNVLLAILKGKSDKLACYRLDLLLEYFPDCLSPLVNDASFTGINPVKLALYQGKDELFEKLDSYSTKKDDVISQDRKGSVFYGLHEAIVAGKMGRVASLLNLKRYPVDALNDERQTPLMLAVRAGNVPMINLLLKQGASVDLCDLYGRHVLHHALDNTSSLEAGLCVLPLLKNPNQADRFGVTPFMKAASKGQISIMRFLYQTRDHIHAIDENGQNALHHAALHNQPKSIAFLLAQQFAVDQAQASISGNYSKLSTPLQIAARYSNENAVFELLKWQADPEKQDADGFNLCEYGILSKNKTMQDFIKRFPAYHDPKRNSYLLQAAVMADQVTIVGELILSQANMNASLNSAGQTALHLAAIFDSGESAELILQGNVIVDLLDRKGFSPLHYAAKNGHVYLIKLLSEKGADLEQKTNEGETALTLACLAAQEGAVAALLQAGADVNHSNQKGMTSAQIALANNQLTIIQLLQEAGDESLQEKIPTKLWKNPLMLFHRSIVATNLPQTNQPTSLLQPTQG